jgi:hypothetical protein
MKLACIVLLELGRAEDAPRQFPLDLVAGLHDTRLPFTISAQRSPLVAACVRSDLGSTP